jgi:phospholipid/cholesterol/gamma-HCH transport system ATP-binding protein
MQKRIALARALIVDPKILFLDEPTAGLDCFMLDIYDNLIQSIRKDSGNGITIVMVTHDLARLWRIADRISILIAGKMYTGTFQELMEHKNEKVSNFLSTYLKVNSIG